MQHAPQISLKLTGGNRDGHWGNLQFVLWRVPLRRWKRGARKYTQEKEQAILWPPWKNCDISRKEMWRHTSKKTDSENTGTGVTWDRWNSDRTGRILLWDKCTVFFNIGPSRANLKVSVDKIGTDWQKAFLIHKKAPHGCITSSPFLQCRLAILHILDSAMVGQGIVSLGGFFTMCRVRVSRPHLKPQVLFLLVQAPHSLHWPTSQPSAEKDRKKWWAVKPQRY